MSLFNITSVDIQDSVKPTSRRRILLGGSTLALIQNGIRMLTGLASVPLTIGYLGKERYGLWMVTLTTLNFVNFFDAGLTPALKNRMAEAFGKQDLGHFRYYSSGSIFLGLCILGLGLVLSLFLPFLNWSQYLKITDPVCQREVLPLVLVVFGTTIAMLAFTQIEAIYAARMQVALTKFYDILCSVFGFLLLLTGILLKVGLPLLAFLVLIPRILAGIVLLGKLYFHDRSLVIPNPVAFPKLLKEIFPLSTAFLGIRFCEVAIIALPNLFIVRLLGLQEVAIFSVAYRLATIPILVTTAILPVFWPVFTVAWSRGEKLWLRKRLALLCAATLLSIGFYACLMGIFGPWVVEIWTRGRISVAGSILLGLGVFSAIQACFYWVSTFLHSISDFRFEFFCHLVWVILLMIFAWFLMLRLNLIGLVIAMSASLTIACLIPMMKRTKWWLSG